MRKWRKRRVGQLNNPTTRDRASILLGSILSNLQPFWQPGLTKTPFCAILFGLAMDFGVKAGLL